MERNVLKDILQNAYSRAKWVSVLQFMSGGNKGLTIFLEPKEIFLSTKKQNEIVRHLFQLGTFRTSDDILLPIFEIELQENIKIEYNRVAVNDLIKSYILRDANKGALATYFYKDSRPNEWRFSFISKHIGSEFFDEAESIETIPKKFTYIFGVPEQHRTAIERIFNLKQSSLYLEDFFEAFNVEPVSKNFFKEYKNFYLDFVHDIATTTNRSIFETQFKTEEEVELDIRNFVKRFMGRLVFLYFLQKKRWLGATNTNYEDGDPNFLEKLFKGELGEIDQVNFYQEWLNKLFFGALNTPDRINDGFKLPSGKVVCVPFLNGGLFEEYHEPIGHSEIKFEVFRIEELFSFFNGYNFTIYENSPDDHTMAVDPEMLGHIFENLLEDNKDKGAFYTPKEVVHYMTQESLIEYLYTQTNKERSNLESLIKNQIIDAFSREELKEIESCIDRVKICDPAIGSGAFPMGLLQEIFSLKALIHFQLGYDVWSPAKIKQDIIQNSIYGVDIEDGAVDIARLRFWLSLVVDEPKPKPLPNLDFKIVVGNSVLSRYDLDVSIDEVFIKFNERMQKNEINIQNTSSLQAYLPLTLNGFKKLLNDYLKESNPEKKELFRSLVREVKESFKTTLSKNEMKKVSTARGKLYNLEQTDMFGNQIGSKNDVAKAKKELAKEEGERDDKLSNKSYANAVEWRFEFPHLLDDEAKFTGFDIVIGNPPYIQLQNNNGELADMLSPMNYETFARTGDIYCLFYERGNQLLSKEGVLTYITSSQWMKASYGKQLRKYFSKFNPIKVLDLGPNVFNTATVHSNILILKNTLNKSVLLGGQVPSAKKIELLSESDLAPVLSLGEDIWTILTSTENNILKTIQDNGKILSKWKVKINFGVKTGYNEAFIIDEKMKNELVRADPKNTEVIKPVLKGREIDRYYVEKNNEYLIAMLPSLDIAIDDYPIIKSYFQGFLPKINQTGETFINAEGKKEKSRKKTSNKWFETQDQISFNKDFSKERVIWKRIGSIMRFSYSNEEMFSLDSTCIATGEKIKYLTAFLNSKLMLYYLHKTSPKTGTGDCIISVQALNPLPVYYPDTETEKFFEFFFEIIMYVRSSNEQVFEESKNAQLHQFFEEVVDGCVFELYFESHMKDKGLNILDQVREAVIKTFGSLDVIEHTELSKKKEKVWQLYKGLKEGEVQKRMRDFVSKSPDVLKPIIQQK